jgi:TolB-like protein
LKGKRSIDRLFPLLPCIAAFTLLHGCLTPRSAFEPVGEEPFIGSEYSRTIYAWSLNTDFGGFVRESDGGTGFFRFPSSGMATLAGSLVGDFRMAFALRLEAPVEYQEPNAIVNFRNYFNTRYCIIVELHAIRLAVARTRHGELTDLARYKTETASNAWYNFEIVAVGSTLKVFMNDRLIIDVIDQGPHIGEGNIVFESHSVYSFRGVVVSKISGFRKIEKAKPQELQAAPIPAPSEKLTVAVSSFESQGVEDFESSLLTDLYSSALLSTGVFRVVERSQIAKVLAEQEFQLSDAADAKHAVTIGRILNAEFLSSGSVGKLGGQYVVTVKLISVETGETLVSARRSFADTEGIPKGLGDLCSQIARDVLSK